MNLTMMDGGRRPLIPILSDKEEFLIVGKFLIKTEIEQEEARRLREREGGGQKTSREGQTNR